MSQKKSNNVVKYVSVLLDCGKYSEALAVPNEEEYENSFKDNCWEITAVLIRKIQDHTCITRPSLYLTCEKLLSIIIEKSAPEEALLEFIEQIELAQNDAQFGIILPPLKEVLKMLPTKRNRSLEWCLNSISTYIERIPITEYPLEEKERMLLDCDMNYRRVRNVYSILPSFYRSFYICLSASEDSVRTKQIITAFLISLLGKPLLYIDLCPDESRDNEVVDVCGHIMKDICFLEKNVLKFLENVEVYFREHTKNSYVKDANENSSPYDHREKINITTISALFYTIFSGHIDIPDSVIPQVYSLNYLVTTLMMCAVHLLNFTEYGPLTKGLALAKAVLYRCPSKLPQNLFSPLHVDMCKALMNVCIYSNYKSLSKQALSSIGLLVNKFDYKGRCLFVKYIIENSNHSGMIGYAITLYKSSVDKSFRMPMLDECFKGPQLTTMLKKICFLPHGAESDLMELADQIITALNFLRYLTIKDSTNRSGICDNFSFIENDYLAKLRVGLNMSKAHYEIKLKDIEEGKALPEEEDNVTINIGGNILDKIPRENKKEILCSALNTFHLMEGLIARLSECINIQKMQQLKMNCDDK